MQQFSFSSRLALAITPLALAGGLCAQWAQITPTTSPSPRRAGAMAFDPTGNRLIAYGGVIASPAQILGETWAYNGTWSQVNTSAPGRWGHRMVTDTANSRIVCFGGRSPTLGALSNDTTVFSGTTWSALPTANAPSPRFLHGMAYDSARDRVVLFGGRTTNGASDQTWEFDGTDWTRITTANSPPPREEMGMVYDSSQNRVVLFGGCDEDTGTVYGDTWIYDGTDWLDQSPPSSPSPRYRGAMVFDTERNRPVYFGGFDGVVTHNSTFEFLGGDWIEITTTSAPTNVTENFHAFDRQREKLVVFGGFSNVFSSATWEYTGDSGGIFTLFGSSCPIGGVEPVLSGTSPTLGQTLSLTIDDISGSFGAVVVLGTSNQTYSGLPLPLDLGVLGLPGCALLVSVDFVEIATAVSDQISYAINVPTQTALLYQSIYVQGLMLDQNLMFSGTTAGARALLGN